MANISGSSKAKVIGGRVIMVDMKDDLTGFLREDPNRMLRFEKLILDVRKNMEKGGYSLIDRYRGRKYIKEGKE